jgi:SAM-dependent methyltransferase
MVYFNTLAEINTAFAHMVGYYDYASASQRPDGQTALQLAYLQPGESILELGAGSGCLMAEAKQRVGAGFCVAVDAVQGFLDTDIPWALNNKGLTVYPNGTPGQQVHLLRANITDGALTNTIRALPGAPQTFDCIIALHVMNTLPPHQRRQTLINLRRLLSPTGRLIVTMSARFTDSPPSPAEVNLPVQFRTTGHTEAPGSHLIMATKATPLVQVPHGGPGQPLKSATMSLQIAPDRLWTVATEQARAAAIHAGFVVDAVRNIGDGDGFGLPLGRHSPAQSALSSMSVVQLGQAANHIRQPGAYGCIGRVMDMMLRRGFQQWNQATPDARNFALVEALQAMTLRDQERVQAGNAYLPSNGILSESLEFPQVGVMMVLRKL